MLVRLFTLLVFTAISIEAHAILEVGVGLSSSNSGRAEIPALAMAITGSDWALSGTSTGAHNDYYYYANYSLAYFKTWKADSFLWSDLDAGFGAGIFYSQRAFQDEGASVEDESSDVGLGPAFRVQWNILSPVYFNLEVIWGLRDIYRHATLNGQDLVTFSVGVEW